MSLKEERERRQRHLRKKNRRLLPRSPPFDLNNNKKTKTKNSLRAGPLVFGVNYCPQWDARVTYTVRERGKKESKRKK